MSDDVVITGLGVLAPVGVGEQEFWDALLSGRSGAARVTGLDTSALSRSIACQVKEAVPTDGITGRAAQLAVAAARQATADAGINLAEVSAERLDVLVGTTMGETEFIENRLAADANDWLSSAHLQEIVGGRPGRLAQQVRSAVAGPGSATDLFGACAAGNMAIASAWQRLRNGECDVAIAGGADGFSRLAFIGFMRLRVMAAEVCRPFDEERDGLLVGEGAAMLVLERESFARARGARVRARLLSGAVTSEDYHPTRPSPDGDGLRRATVSALASASLRPSDIDYVCAHGTGTPQNDMIEVKVMQSCFPAGVPFSSIKALTGHTMGATAAVEAVTCVLSLEKQTLVPTWNLEKPMPVEPLTPLRGAPCAAKVQYVLNNSAGFGGYNSSIILARA
jgi:3-oxoacyl-[acyl-carrier-protein] synthase II